jgi:hypothetical protein
MKFAMYVKQRVFPSLCADCKIKIARKFHFTGSIMRVHHKRKGHKVPKGSKRYKQLLRNLAKARRARRK